MQPEMLYDFKNFIEEEASLQIPQLCQNSIRSFQVTLQIYIDNDDD